MKLITFALAGLLCAVGATHAQDKPYPTRPVTIIRQGFLPFLPFIRFR